jgi:DNA-binding LacI/PurR family transcriptional regulator
MMRSTPDRSDALLWGHACSSVQESVQEADQMLQSFIAQKVAGVFFAPIELTQDKDAVNGRIVSVLEHAKIPIVLLDRCFLPYPERSRHDLVGIDNHRAGFVATAHLLKMSVRRVVFLGEVNSASTVDMRISGFYLAMRTFGIKPDWEPTWRGSPQDTVFVRKMLDSARPEAVVCANDITAARLMQTLIGLGVRIPDEVHIVGMDDVKYASLLPVPLTTIHQNCPEIGAVAMSTMIERLKNPGLPTRDVLVPFRLVVRRSCGTPAPSTPATK